MRGVAIEKGIIILAYLGIIAMVTPGEIGVYEGTMVGVFALFGIPLSTGVSLALVDHFVRASVTIVFGMISTVHLGFASRAYFAEMKRNSRKTDDVT